MGSSAVASTETAAAALAAANAEPAPSQALALAALEAPSFAAPEAQYLYIPGNIPICPPGYRSISASQVPAAATLSIPKRLPDVPQTLLQQVQDG